MSTLHRRRKMFSPKPIRLNWTDRLSSWAEKKIDASVDWMNGHPFISSLVFFFVVFTYFFMSLEV